MTLNNVLTKSREITETDIQAICDDLMGYTFPETLFYLQSTVDPTVVAIYVMMDTKFNVANGLAIFDHIDIAKYYATKYGGEQYWDVRQCTFDEARKVAKIHNLHLLVWVIDPFRNDIEVHWLA